MLMVNQISGFNSSVSNVLTPDEIATLWGWWAPDSMNGTTTLTSWTDKSGNGRTLTPQGSNPGKGTGGPNGYAHVDIDCVSVSGNERLEGSESSVGQLDRHVFAVIRIDTYTANRFVLYGDNDGGNSGKGLIRIDGSSKITASTSTVTQGLRSAVWTSANVPTAGSWALIEMWVDDTVVVGLNIDDGTPVTFSLSGEGGLDGNGKLDGLTVANQGVGNEGVDASFSEIIIYPAVLTTQERQQLIDYLADKYGAIGSW